MDSLNIKIVTKQGSEISLLEWQKLYGLTVGSTMIGKYFSFNEPKFQQNLKQYGKLVVNELLIRLLDEFRKRTGVPVFISAFNRSDEYQEKLAKTPGYLAAKNSPHVVYMGADLRQKSKEETIKNANLLLAIAKELGIGIRVGFNEYLKAGQLFIHVDVCPEYFAPGKPFHHIKHHPYWEINYLTW